MNIALFCGGESAERAVSLLSGAAVEAALGEMGHTVSKIDWRGEDTSPDFLSRFSAYDAVFLALHGGAGEDGRLAAALEKNGIFSYTGSPPATSALAADKEKAKRRVAAAGIPVARGTVVGAGTRAENAALPPFPLAAKPLCGGSSVGLCFFRTKKELSGLVFDESMLFESYLPGREYSVSFLCNEILPVVEICPDGGVYDYFHKYTPGVTKEVCPAKLTVERYEKLRDLARRAVDALGLRDFARVDFREDARGEPRFLEANAIPGMTKTSLLPLAARTAGLSFPEVCDRIARAAAARGKRAGEA